MKSRKENSKLTEGRNKTTKPRFQIVKLEERIAPARGGVPGPDGGGGGHECSPGRYGTPAYYRCDR
jgi:hypothetical protein